MIPKVDLKAFTRRDYFSRYETGNGAYTSSYFIKLDKDQLDRSVASHFFEYDKKKYTNSVSCAIHFVYV